MDMRQLEYCAAVARYQSFSRAADNLFVSRQALSKSIKQLEKELGQNLFILKNNLPVLTDFGEMFLCDSSDVVRGFEALHHKYYSLSGNRGAVLSIAVAHGVSFSIPSQIYNGILELGPSMRIAIEEVHTDAALEMVRDGEAEIGLVGSFPGYLGGYEWLRLGCYGLYVYVPKSSLLARKEVLKIADLDGIPFVTAGQHNHLHRFFVSACREQGVHPDIMLTSSDASVLLNAATKNGAFCFGFPKEIVPNAFEWAETVRVDIEGAEDFGTYAIRRKGEHPSNALKRVWEYLETLTPDPSQVVRSGPG